MAAGAKGQMCLSGRSAIADASSAWAPALSRDNASSKRPFSSAARRSSALSSPTSAFLRSASPAGAFSMILVRRYCAVAACPPTMASNSGVAPNLSATWASKPLCLKQRATHWVWPRRAATASTVRPFLLSVVFGLNAAPVAVPAMCSSMSAASPAFAAANMSTSGRLRSSAAFRRPRNPRTMRCAWNARQTRRALRRKWRTRRALFAPRWRRTAVCRHTAAIQCSVSSRTTRTFATFFCAKNLRTIFVIPIDARSSASLLFRRRTALT
mmetsp:Transcript_38988/g.122125  ORF Transcript_38988/g.122125 Transcript_38988/m.122125 type:complete len:269 (-) Transcript_38988:103-909(-)